MVKGTKDKEVHFIGGSKKALQAFPKDVKSSVGHAIHIAQQGGRVDYVKPFKGTNPASIEVVEDFDTDTYRAVYTVKLEPAVYVLHAFKKKSKRGIETPKITVDLIKKRLQEAEKHHKKNYERIKK